MTPQRIQLSRKKGWRKPENTVVVARPSKWGNPFRIVRTDCSMGGLCWAVALGGMVVQQHIDSQERARALAVHFFRSWIEEEDHHDLPDPAELAGKNLACWCPLPAPGEPDICHAAVLLELANTTEGNTPRSQTDRTEP